MFFAGSSVVGWIRDFKSERGDSTLVGPKNAPGRRVIPQLPTKRDALPSLAVRVLLLTTSFGSNGTGSHPLHPTYGTCHNSNEELVRD